MEKVTRRRLLQGSVSIAGTSIVGSTAASAVIAGSDPYDYEITRTERDWRALLGDDYGILREGKTEKPKSSPLWTEAREGHYDCKGCGLEQYRSNAKVNLTKGWVFFTAGEPNAQLMSQDGRAEMSDNPDAFDIFIEVHCRRCASHMGHILMVEGKALHCINGASLNFHPVA